MNVILETNQNKISLKRKIIYIVVLTICIIAILVGAYIQVFKTNGKVGNGKYVELTDEQNTKLENDFSEIFKNNINISSDFDLSKVEKISPNADIIANEYINTDKEVNKYNFNITVPYINIKSPTIQKYNSEIQSIFKQKALDIIESNYDNNTIYTVEYTAYINNNILSLVIRSTLKEDNSAQRIIVQTYNYNLEKNKVATIDNLLDIKGISSNYAESKVREKVKISQAKVEELKKLGYNIFDRDYKSAIYKMQNATEFFFGENGHLYLIYAYGNQNFTSEVDIIVF
ncbi:MAG: hypothetical protein HFJ47_00915 [Clostridia bacterium]|nr:hypothetical protein [Clostridia bacterium]